MSLIKIIAGRIIAMIITAAGSLSAVVANHPADVPVTDVSTDSLLIVILSTILAGMKDWSAKKSQPPVFIKK